MKRKNLNHYVWKYFPRSQSAGSQIYRRYVLLSEAISNWYPWEARLTFPCHYVADGCTKFVIQARKPVLYVLLHACCWTYIEWKWIWNWILLCIKCLWLWYESDMELHIFEIQKEWKFYYLYVFYNSCKKYSLFSIVVIIINLVREINSRTKVFKH